MKKLSASLMQAADYQPKIRTTDELSANFQSANVPRVGDTFFSQGTFGRDELLKSSNPKTLETKEVEEVESESLSSCDGPKAQQPSIRVESLQSEPKNFEEDDGNNSAKRASYNRNISFGKQLTFS